MSNSVAVRGLPVSPCALPGGWAALAAVPVLAPCGRRAWVLVWAGRLPRARKVLAEAAAKRAVRARFRPDPALGLVAHVGL
jgi:hypothetical protein